VEDARRRPLGLVDRVIVGARDPALAGDVSLAVEVGDPELGPVPRQVRMVPLQPAQPAPVRREPRVGVEVGAFRDSGLVTAVEAEPDDRVDRFAAAGVVLADREQQGAAAVDGRVRVAPVAGRRDRRRPLMTLLSVEPLVVEVREPDGALARDVSRAAVLVDARARVETGRRDVSDGAVGRPPDDDQPAALGRAPFAPVDVLAVDGEIGQPDAAGDDRVRRDRRPPGAVGGDFGQVS
jgi:hypothetical protein